MKLLPRTEGKEIDLVSFLVSTKSSPRVNDYEFK